VDTGLFYDQPDYEGVFDLKTKKAVAEKPPVLQPKKAENKIKTNEPPIEPGSLHRAYLNRLFETTSQVSLSGIDPNIPGDAKSHLQLSAVYTALLTLTPEQEQPEMKIGMSDRERKLLSALQQLEQHPRLVLMGDPGSGKSTFINFVTMCLAGESLGNPAVNLKSLQVPLPDDEGNAGKEAQSGIEAWAGHLKKVLLEQGGLLLLDGLDEVPEADYRRDQIKDVILDFAKTYHQCRILVTSRTYAYQKQDWKLPDFTEAILAPFSQGQIRQFVDRWYAHTAELRGTNREDAQGRAVLLKQTIFASERLRVTNLEYERFNPEHKKQRDKYFNTDDEPVVNVSWDEANRYCRWLSDNDKTGRQYRLPDEAE
jgi:energy-coupling factor transporter ATP-binding protein EcfA2